MGDFVATVCRFSRVHAHLKGNASAGGIGLVGAADIALAPACTTFSFSAARLGPAPAIISQPRW